MSRKGLLLAVDTSTHVASAALYDGVSVRAEMTWESPRRHTTELAPQVVTMLEKLRVDISAVTGLAVALGPGSFTGLRIGVALVKGLAVARAIPLVGIPTLDISAHPIRPRRATLYAILQAGRGRICVAPYRWRRQRWRRSGDLALMTWDELVADVRDRAVFCGEIDAKGLEALKSCPTKPIIVSASRRLRRAGHLAEIAWERLRRGERDDPATLQPIYLHTV